MRSFRCDPFICSILGGSNFEYFSKNPVVAGKMATAYIEGVAKVKASARP
jgi:hypothetical protein